MPTATKSPNGIRKDKRNRHRPSNADTWAAQYGRGLFRWRVKKSLTVKEASAKHDIDLTSWYRIEKGQNDQTTALYIDQLRTEIGLSAIDVLKLGEELVSESELGIS